MDHGFLAVISFLMGSIVAGSFLGLGYLRDIRKFLKQSYQALDDQNMKLDCIAEWLIDQDPDSPDYVPDYDNDYGCIDDPNDIDHLIDLFHDDEDRAILKGEDSKK